MKPLTVDTALRSTQQKGTDSAQKTASGAFLNSGKPAAGTIPPSLGPPIPRGLGKVPSSAFAPGFQRDVQMRVQDLLSSLKLKFTVQNEVAVRALMSEGLPLTLKLIQTLGRVQRKHPGEEAASARIASRALAAGIDPESDEMSAFWAQFLVSGTGGESGFGENTGGKQRQGSNPQAGEDSTKEDELASALADVCIQAFKNPGMLEFCRPGPLQKAWVHVPFAFFLDSVEFSGVFRILYNYSNGITECLVADIKTGEARRLLCVSGRDSSICLRYGSDKAEESAAVKASMARQGFDILVYPSPGQLDDELMDMSLDRAAHV